MKKLLVMFIVCMLPLVVACRLVENDDPGPTITPNVQLPNGIKVVFPNQLVSAQIKYSQLKLKFGDETLDPQSASSDGSNVVVIFKKPTKSYNLGAIVNCEVIVEGSNQKLVQFKVKLSTSAEGIVGINEIKVTLHNDGSVTVNVVDSNDAYVSQPTDQPTNQTTQELNEALFYVKSVKYASGTQEIDNSVFENESNVIAKVDSLSPTFIVELSKPYDSIPASFSFTCVNLTDNTQLTLTEEDVQATAVSESNTKINLTLKTSSTKKLEKNKLYKVTLNTPIKMKNSDVTIKDVTRYFKTTENAN